VKVREYFASVQGGILSLPFVIHSNLSFDEISESEGYVRGILILSGGFELHVAEYVVFRPKLHRLKYRYHLQTPEGTLVIRWDNAAHHPEVSTHPYHSHTMDGQVKPAGAMDILMALEAAIPLIG
jgi:hypothetical protein